MTHEPNHHARDDHDPEPLAAHPDSVDAFAPIARALTRANDQIEIPPGLIDRIDEHLRAAAGRRRILLTASLAAAAVVAVAVTAWLVAGGGLAAVEPSVESPFHLTQSAPSRSPAAVVFEPTSPYFAVPVETESPNVSIVFVYQNLNTPEPPGGSNEPTPTTQGSDT